MGKRPEKYYYGYYYYDIEYDHEYYYCTGNVSRRCQNAASCRFYYFTSHSSNMNSLVLLNVASFLIGKY